MRNWLIGEVKELHEAMKRRKREKDALKQKVQQQEEMPGLRNEMNDRESHARSWSIRKSRTMTTTW
jgi:predicted Holliday junction resolvase-like endonuclease